MAVNHGWSADDDPLERTDLLPVLVGSSVDPDVADDAVPLDAPPAPLLRAAQDAQAAASALGRELAEARAELAAAQAELAAVGAEFAAVRAELSTVNAELAAARTELAVTGAELEAERVRGRDLQHALTERDTAMTAREAELVTLRLDLQDVKSQAAERARLLEEAAGRDVAHTQAREQLSEENRALRLALERAHSEINALKVGPPAGAGANEALDLAAEFVRVDGAHASAHSLMRRMRIGRAPGCELQIDSSSVSRQHALLVMNSREILIEDLQSTNGILVNGRRVSRQVLRDGDIVSLGEVLFRLDIKSGARAGSTVPPAAAPASAAADGAGLMGPEPPAPVPT